VNEIGKVTPKSGGALDRKPKAAGRSWVDRFAGTLDEDFARGALDSWPEKDDQRDASCG